MRCCSTGCAAKARSPSSRNGGAGRKNLLAAYRAVDSQDHWWHLPDGRTIRVVANPQPKGGVTWVFENLTEKMDLESRYTHGGARAGRDARQSGRRRRGVRPRRAHPPVQPGLRRAVGAVGRHRRPEDAYLGDPGALRRAGRTTARGAGFVASVTGFDDERRDRHGQTELKNGTVLRYAVIHLPNGQVMMTFVDVTDSVNVERALKEKNEALQKADQLKNDFVQHVSYELRSPLTNIIGFTELLSLPATGPLSRASANMSSISARRPRCCSPSSTTSSTSPPSMPASCELDIAEVERRAHHRRRPPN